MIYPDYDFDSLSVKDISNKIAILLDKEKEQEVASDHKTSLHIGMLWVKKIPRYTRAFTFSPLFLNVKLNKEDISGLYGIISGEDKVQKAFDIFLGKYSDKDQILIDFLGDNSVDLLEKRGIKRKERNIIGPLYNEGRCKEDNTLKLELKPE